MPSTCVHPMFLYTSHFKTGSSERLNSAMIQPNSLLKATRQLWPLQVLELVACFVLYIMIHFRPTYSLTQEAKSFSATSSGYC